MTYRIFASTYTAFLCRMRLQKRGFPSQFAAAVPAQQRKGGRGVPKSRRKLHTPNTEPSHWKLCDEQQNKAPPSADWFDRMQWPEIKVLKALRAGHASFSLHEYGELEELLQTGKAQCISLCRDERVDRGSFFGHP